MLLSLLLAGVLEAPPATSRPFEFQHGDRIVWIGGTLVEREQRYGYWETALLTANAGKTMTVRNLGWSGDTVHGESRGRFDFANADKCFRQIVDQTLALKPTVIFISYGTNEAFEGKAGLARFEKGLEKLLDGFKPAGARIVLFSPMRFHKAANLPDPAPLNEKLALYRDSIKRIATNRGHYFADTFTTLDMAAVPITDNGMHLTEEGYRATAAQFLAALGHDAPRVNPAKFNAIRAVVIEKNELFFHRWRPQNETYLFGFRKHEQGKNAQEVAAFDPLIHKKEEELAKLLQEYQE